MTRNLRHVWFYAIVYETIYEITCQTRSTNNGKKGAKTVKTESTELENAMAEIVSCSSTSGETLMKASGPTSSGCLFCGAEKSDSQKRTNLKGKLKISLRGAANALDIPLIPAQYSLLQKHQTS